MSTPASDGEVVESSVALLIANDDEVIGRSRFLVVTVAVEGMMNDETKDLRAVPIHIHGANNV